MGGRDNKGARGNFEGVMHNLFTIFIVVMFLWLYANVDLTKLYTLKMCSLLYINYTLIKLFKNCFKICFNLIFEITECEYFSHFSYVIFSTCSLLIFLPVP